VCPSLQHAVPGQKAPQHDVALLLQLRQQALVVVGLPQRRRVTQQLDPLCVSYEFGHQIWMWEQSDAKLGQKQISGRTGMREEREDVHCTLHVA
jgi:hypothetical protein